MCLFRATRGGSPLPLAGRFKLRIDNNLTLLLFRFCDRCHTQLFGLDVGFEIFARFGIGKQFVERLLIAEVPEKSFVFVVVVAKLCVEFQTR